MILANHSQLRRFFAAPGATTDARDGLLEFPGPLLPDGSVDNSGATGLLRANGFASTLLATSTGGHIFSNPGPIGPLIDATKLPGGDMGFPFTVTCNGGLVDAVAGVHDYDWFPSMRLDPGRQPSAGGQALVAPAPSYFVITMPNASKSGTLSIDLNLSAVAALLPGLSGAQLVTSDSLATLFRNCALYTSRRSDRAYQWARLVAES